MLAVAIIRAATDSGIPQIGNNPATYLGGTFIGGVMGWVIWLAAKIIKRGDTREARQWAQVDADLKRKDQEIERVTKSRDHYLELLRNCQDTLAGRKLHDP